MKSYPLSETSGSGVWSNSGLAKIAQTVKKKLLEMLASVIKAQLHIKLVVKRNNMSIKTFYLGR